MLGRQERVDVLRPAVFVIVASHIEGVSTVSGGPSCAGPAVCFVRRHPIQLIARTSGPEFDDGGHPRTDWLLNAQEPRAGTFPKNALRNRFLGLL